MVTIPFFDVLHFIFKIGGAQRPKWTFLADKKCPFWGGQNWVFSLKQSILNELFSAG